MGTSVQHELGFFFTASTSNATRLYYAGFQKRMAYELAHQIIIAEVEESRWKNRQVAYVVDRDDVPRLDNETREHLCRIAVGQFLSMLALSKLPACSMRLELACAPWDGQILTV